MPRRKKVALEVAGVDIDDGDDDWDTRRPVDSSEYLCCGLPGGTSLRAHQANADLAKDAMREFRGDFSY